MPESTLARIKESPGADRAKEELERYLLAQAERLLAGAGRAVGRSTAHLNAMADGSSPGLKALAVDVARKISKGRGPLRAVIESGAKQVKDRAAHTLRERLGGRDATSDRGEPDRGRPTVILESVDVGAPVKDAYDLWTLFGDLPRGRAVHVTEQVPGERIAWTSEGPGGTTRGVVTFHELAVDLTRVLLVIEHHPQGLLEKASALVSAPGRRARQHLEDYAGFLTVNGGEADGRRGAIGDGADTGEPDEIDAEDTTDLYDDEAGDVDEVDDVDEDEEYEGAYDDGYEDEAEELDAEGEQADPDEEADPEEEPEAARPRGRRGNRRPA